MLKHRFYYAIKPFVPWSVRMALRRVAARRSLARTTGMWPIDAAARRPPEAWTGWPDGKKFAVVLTHDVEGPSGLAKCSQLMAIEQSLGFRSSFNFIPEGSYRIPDAFRAEITKNGFEVGVHDLRHDGKLFQSRRSFRENAARINHYIKQWGASGYRSGFMLRNLDWLHALDIGYDSSTFDTDPFEFQPDGAGTIFPYWIPTPKLLRSDTVSPFGRPGYVELPYTLPQDSTLFLVLQEKTPETWIRKLDWVAKNGGMVLVNVHPDYMRFPGEAESKRTYPCEHYIALLEYIRNRYAGAYWQALPREVAQFTAASEQPRVLRKNRRVGMITHSFYENDNRVTRYAEALAARGDHVDVISLRRSASTATHEVIEGVNVHRLQDRFGKTEQSKLSFLWPTLRFLWFSSRWLTDRHARQRYDVLHIHNMPDFLVYAGWYAKLTGARIILDIHDIVPEFYSSKFAGGKVSMTARALRVIERCSAHFADHVIISNHLWFEKYTARTGTIDKCSVYINNVDTRIFHPHPRTRTDNKWIVLFPGGLQWHQGLDIALRAFVRVSQTIPNIEFHIYGDGNMKPSLLALTHELGLDEKVRFFEPVGVRQVAQIMADADLGVVPKRADSFGNEAYSTKIMEFMSLGVPVVVSKTKIDQYYFNDAVVRFFDSGNSEALAEGMLQVITDPDLRQRMVANALVYAERHSWTSRRHDYLKLVDDLIEQGVARPVVAGPDERSQEPGVRSQEEREIVGARTPSSATVQQEP